MRPDPISRQLRERHWTMLCLASFIIAASYFLRQEENQAVRLPWSEVGLPPICGSRLVFGVECPGCGLTRSFVALAAGDFGASWRHHRVGWLMALVVIGQIPVSGIRAAGIAQPNRAAHMAGLARILIDRCARRQLDVETQWHLSASGTKAGLASSNEICFNTFGARITAATAGKLVSFRR